MLKPGRPKSFNRDVILDKFMYVFLKYGYENCQVIDLIKESKINPPSFYATFKSKEDTFLEVLELYSKQFGAKTIAALEEADTVYKGIFNMLNVSISNAMLVEFGSCLIMLGDINCSKERENIKIINKIKELRAVTKKAITTKLISAQEQKEISMTLDANDLAEFYMMIMQSISLQVREGKSKTEIIKLIRLSMKPLEITT